MEFVMRTEKQGRIKYLLLTIAPYLILMQLFVQLTEAGILPRGKILSQVYVYLPLALMCVASYFLILKKNHTIEVSDQGLIEEDWHGKFHTISVHKIRSVRRNWLGELRLLDEDGRVLVCVETNMSNYDRFQKWLELRHFNTKKGAKT